MNDPIQVENLSMLVQELFKENYEIDKLCVLQGVQKAVQCFVGSSSFWDTLYMKGLILPASYHRSECPQQYVQHWPH